MSNFPKEIQKAELRLSNKIWSIYYLDGNYIKYLRKFNKEKIRNYQKILETLQKKIIQ